MTVDKASEYPPNLYMSPDNLDHDPFAATFQQNPMAAAPFAEYIDFIGSMHHQPCWGGEHWSTQPGIFSYSGKAKPERSPQVSARMFLMSCRLFSKYSKYFSFFRVISQYNPKLWLHCMLQHCGLKPHHIKLAISLFTFAPLRHTD